MISPSRYLERPRSRSRRSLGALIVSLVATLAASLLAAASGGAATSSASRTQADDLFVAYVDGSCGNSWRTHVRAEIEDEVSKHPEITKFVYKCAQGKLDQGISAIQALSAQGVDILVVISDWGKPLLPALRAAHRKGVTVVPWDIPVGGTAGKDYTAYVGFNIADQAKLFADYMIKKLKGKGNVVGIGGPAGNDYDKGHVDVMKAEFAKRAPGIKFLEMAPADWAPAPSAKATGTLLSKYPKIDAVWSPEATTVKPILDQFIAAGRPLPVITSLDVNGMMGEFPALKKKSPTLAWGFVSALTWGVRNALLVGLDAKAGKPLDKSLLTLKNFISDCQTACQKLYKKDLPADYIPTTKVPVAKMKKALG